MVRAVLDHLVVTAPALDAGAAVVGAALGAVLQPGGRHERMGTHNRLLGLGPDAYLEVIAVEPGAPAPGRPRWFELDALQATADAPRLATWALRVDDIEAAHAALGGLCGPIVAMARGAYRWRISIPDDGALPLGGGLPALIQWDGDAHPCAALPDQGLRLQSLAIAHPEPERLRALLQATGFDGPVVVTPAPAVRLQATLLTPAGERSFPPD